MYAEHFSLRGRRTKGREGGGGVKFEREVRGELRARI